MSPIKINILFVFLLIMLGFVFILSSCVDDEGTNKKPIKKEKITGFVQKGPYVRGTSILMSELNFQLAQTGKVFTSQGHPSTLKTEPKRFALHNPTHYHSLRLCAGYHQYF